MSGNESSARSTYSHVGLCVCDLARSIRFYCEGLGFELDRTVPVDSRFTAALEVDGEATVTAQYLRKDGIRIELLAFQHPRPTGTPSRSRGTLGLTHLSFIVDDVAAVAAALVALGGTVIDSTRLRYDLGTGPNELLFLADPDGIRVELLKRPAG